MTKKTITVRATDPAKPCPTEARKRVRLYVHVEATKTKPAVIRDRHCIYHDTPIEVPYTRYYRRRIVRGDLEEVKPAKPKRKTTTTTTSEAKS